MNFKVDENLPIEVADLLNAAGYDAKTVIAQKLQGASDLTIAEICKSENRVLVTLDMDFADIQVYPPKEYPGFIVMRVSRHDKRRLIEVFQRIISLINREPLAHNLWIVEESRVRIRGEVN